MSDRDADRPGSSIQSARAIIVRDGAVALIERHRAGRHYFLFPGGKLEPGETPEQALAREVEEETGLVVRAAQLVAEVTFPDRVQTFWLAEIRGGTFGTGTGPEMTDRMPPDRGTYRAVWLSLPVVMRTTVYPARIAAELAARGDGPWPATVLRFDDPYRWWE
jgi:mutator protein MutT